MPECFVAKVSDMQDGDRRIVVSGKHEVGVFFKDGDYYAYSNYCVHAGGPACEGIMVNKVVDIIAKDRTYEGQTFSDELHFVCPWHGDEYDIKTGECAGDRRLKLRKYDVGKRGEEVFVARLETIEENPWTCSGKSCATSTTTNSPRRSRSSTPASRRGSATIR